MTTSTFLTSHLGSVPYTDPRAAAEKIAEACMVPAWPQMARLNFRENMYVQYSAKLPGIVLDADREKVYFDVDQDLTGLLEAFYEHALTDDLDYFALTPDYAAGFYALLDVLSGTQGTWIKGQVTGPISFGLTVTDQNLRASLYHPDLADTLVRNAALIACWQIAQLKAVRPNVVIFVDEPYMASFGSAFISLSREEAVTMLNEVFNAIKADGALAGVHCCANTDWSVLLDTTADILNLDSFDYIENLALYPAELRAFLDRGGRIAWGSIPNNPEILNHTPDDLLERLHNGINAICRKAAKRDVTITPDDLLSGSFLLPACGLGSTTPDIADRTFDTLSQIRER